MTLVAQVNKMNCFFLFLVFQVGGGNNTAFSFLEHARHLTNSCECWCCCSIACEKAPSALGGGVGDGNPSSVPPPRTREFAHRLLLFIP